MKFTMSRNRRRNWRTHSGAAAIEAALVLPLLFLLFCCLSDLYILLDECSSFVHISREASLTGRLAIQPANYSGGETNLDPTYAEVQSCYQSPITGSCAHKIIHWRVRRLSESYRIRSNSPLQIESNIRYAADLESSSMGYSLVTVAAAVEPPVLFSFFKNQLVRGRASAG